MFEKWLHVSDVKSNFELLKQLIVAVKIIPSVPGRLSTFLIEQRADTLQRVHEIGAAYYDGNKDVFATCSTPDVAIGAAARTNQVPQSKN